MPPTNAQSTDDQLDNLLSQVGLRRSEMGGVAQIIGDDPVVPSRLKLGTAVALALAAQGAAVACIQKMRSGVGDDVSVRVADACRAIHGFHHLKQSGYSIGVNAIGPGNDFFRTADDRFIYITMVKNDQRNGLLGLLECANSNESIARAVAKWKGEELEAACIRQGLPLSMVRTQDEWLSHPQGRWISETPVVTIDKIHDSAPRSFGSTPRPLSDIRVADATQFLAGPNVGRTLAEQGADVLRISMPESADYNNFIIDTGMGKRSAYLDFSLKDDMARLRSLVMDADVFVHSFRDDSLKRRNMTIDSLVERHPGLICVTVSCFGAGGPWKDWIGYDPNAQAVTGITTVEGSPAAPARPQTLILADYITGFLGALGVLAALVRQSREGGSYDVKVSLAQTCSWLLGLGLVDRDAAPDAPEPPRLNTMESAFGRLEYLAPVTQFSRNKAYWQLPPVPLGASDAVWLPRPKG